MEKEPLYIMDIDYKQARKIAKKFARENGLELGSYAGRGKHDNAYRWHAENPENYGMIIGWPGYIFVDDLGVAIFDRGPFI